MKIRIELTSDEVDMVIKNYIRDSGMTIPDNGDLYYIKSLAGERPEMIVAYEVEIE